MDNFWQDKKILFYIALLHHTRFMTPVADFLKQAGANVQFVVGQAERSQEITAIECDLNYHHVFDYLSDEDWPTIHENYLLERQTFKRGLCKDFALGAQLVTVIDKTLFSSAMEYIGFRNLLKTESPDLCFSLHEVNRWGKMFSFWAKKFNIPFITLQEGLNYNLDFGYTGQVQNCTLDLLWGERVRKKLAGYEAPIDRMIPVGNTHLSREITQQKKAKIRQKLRKKYKCKDKLAILFLFSSRLPDQSQVEAVFKSASENKNVILFAKFHPATKKLMLDKWTSKINAAFRKNAHFILAEENTYDLISLSDICVLAQPSTTGLESLAFGKPLIQLDIEIKIDIPYSFSDLGVAQKMTPDQLADAIRSKQDFSQAIPKETVDAYLTNELFDRKNVTERVINIFKDVITANRPEPDKPLVSNRQTDRPWTIIAPVTDNPEQFLVQLEAIATHSETSGSFELILIRPSNLSEATQAIIGSLEGDLQVIEMVSDESLFCAMNRAAISAKGEYLCFLSPLLVPCPDWLTHLSAANEAHPEGIAFGGKVINQFDNIVHAGMVLTINNEPVSAYMHLDSRFPSANHERPFQMVDDFVMAQKEKFLKFGGFTPEAGRYSYMDFCLKVGKASDSDDAVYFIPGSCFVKLGDSNKPLENDSACYFYGRWHGQLWDSERTLYDTDGVSDLQLEAARLTRAMQAASG